MRVTRVRNLYVWGSAFALTPEINFFQKKAARGRTYLQTGIYGVTENVRNVVACVGVCLPTFRDGGRRPPTSCFSALGYPVWVGSHPQTRRGVPRGTGVRSACLAAYLSPTVCAPVQRTPTPGAVGRDYFCPPAPQRKHTYLVREYTVIIPTTIRKAEGKYPFLALGQRSKCSQIHKILSYTALHFGLCLRL